MKSGKGRVFQVVLLVAQTSMLVYGNPALAQVQPQPSAPLSPAAGEPPLPPEVPLAPPEVTCKGDQLTIAARGATLSSLLRAIHNCTGAKIDVPDNVSQSRFFDTIGPGPVRDVLASLLDDTNFDYVIGASESDPQKIETILLMARGQNPSNQSNSDDRSLPVSRRAFAQMRRNYMTAGVPGVNESAGPAEESNASPADETPAQQPAVDAAGTSPPAATEQAAPAPAPSEATPAPAEPPSAPPPDASPVPAQQKTLDDQINSMEQLFQQRAQMIANQQQSQQQH